MIMDLFPILVVVCLAAGASSVRLPWAKTEIDFKGLNKHLLAKLDHSEPKQQNLAQIEADMDSFKPGVRKAAEVVLKLAEVNHNTQCDDQLLATLRAASAGGMTSYADLKPKRRVEMLIRPELVMALNACTRYIGDTFPKVVEATGADLLKFSDNISPKLVKHLRAKYSWPGSTNMARVLARLAADDPKTWQNDITRESLVFEDGRVFNYAYKKHLVEPCNKFIDTFDHLLTGATAIAKMRADMKQFGEAPFDSFRRMARTNSLCREIIRRGKHNSDTSSIFLVDYSNFMWDL